MTTLERCADNRDKLPSVDHPWAVPRGDIPVTIESMIPILQKLVRAGVSIEAGTRRAWEGIQRLFLSQVEHTRRTSGRSEALKRRELEAERLDRLRNPRDYQGR